MRETLTCEINGSYDVSVSVGASPLDTTQLSMVHVQSHIPPTCLDQQFSWGMPLLSHDLFQLPDPGEYPYESETNIPKQHNYEKVTDICPRWYTTTVMSLIIGTIELFKHPLFQERSIVVIQAFKNPYLKLLFQYPNTYTLRSLNRCCQMPTNLWQFLRSNIWVTERLLAYYRHFPMSTTLLQSFWIASRLLLSLWSLNGGCQTCTSLWQSLWSSTGVAKCVLAFNSLCGARAGFAKHVLTFDSLCRAEMGAAKCVIAFDSLCRAQTGVTVCLLAFDSLWTSLVIVTSNVCSVFVWNVL